MAELKIKADSGGGTVSFKGPATTTSNAAVQLTLPVDDGTANQYLKTDGSGALSWATVDTSIADDSIVEAKLDVSNAPTNGQFLQAQSGEGGGLTWAAVSGNPITVADCWRVHTIFDSHTGSYTTISANWERSDDNPLEGGITSSQMSESSGVFTFPSTGIYRVEFFATASTNDWSQNPHEEINITLNSTDDNGASAWSEIAKSVCFITDVPNPGRHYNNMAGSAIVDITNTSNDKIRLMEKTSYTGIRFEGMGHGNFGPTLSFIRLGDT